VVLRSQSFVKLAEYACWSGTFKEVAGQVVDPVADCSYNTTVIPVYRDNSLIVFYSISSSCGTVIPDNSLSSFIHFSIFLIHFLQDSGSPNGLSTEAFLAIVIAVPIVGVCILIAVVLLSVPKLRERVFPYRDRAYHLSAK